MATRDYWAEAPMNRQQTVLFGPTLDSTINEDDPVRLFDEVLGGMDWSGWEVHYDGTRGQPPIHPRFMCAALLYGLCRGIRSSRKLEEACHYRLDFMWLVEGRRIDHTTLGKFRTKFSEPLKDLFQQIGRVAMSMGLIRLGEVAFDGTRVKANNNRFRCRTAKSLEEKLQALDQLFEEMMEEARAADAAEASRSASDGDDANSPTQLPGPLADLKQRRERIREALSNVQEADRARSKRGVNPQTHPVRVPTTDLDARVMPNKAGRLHNSCFVYDPEGDQYYCPQGKSLPFVRTKSSVQDGVRKTSRIYRCKSCKDCLLAGICFVRVTHSGRTISRGQ